jgi:hypothetical protein
VKKPALVLVVAVVLALAAVVWHNMPYKTDVYAPFDVHGSTGSPVAGRGLTTTVTGVRISPRVGSAPAAGVWAVIDATAEATVQSEIPHADLIVGPNTYSPSERFQLQMLGGEPAPGIVQRGAWVFDVPAALLDAGTTKSMALRVWLGDARLDSRLVIRIGLEDPRVTRSDVTTLSPLEAAGT